MKCRRNNYTSDLELELYYPECGKNPKCGSRPAYLAPITRCREFPIDHTFTTEYLELNGEFLEVTVDGVHYSNLQLKT